MDKILPNKIIYIVGVSSCGKSTIGKMLAEKFGMPFFDGDDFHSNKNIEKMKSGRPLNDEDRHDWLKAINIFAQQQSQLSGAIIACSALKKKYRQVLRKGIEIQPSFIFLKGDLETIKSRMQHRGGHFMPIKLLQAQFDDLEEPDSALVIDISMTPEQILEKIN